MTTKTKSELNPLNEGDLNGFVMPFGSNQSVVGFNNPQATAVREAAITSAMRMINDLRNARLPYYYLHEALKPSNPAVLSSLNNNYPHILRESLSISDFPLLMGDVLNRVLIQRFRARAGAWRDYIRFGTPLADFRTARRIKTDGGDGQWNKLTEFGGLKYTKMDEAGYTLTPDLYGKGIKLSFRQLLNDDLGAFDEIPAILARGGRRTLAKFATGLIFDASGPKSSFVSAGNGNLITGNPAFDINSLGTAYKQLLSMKDSEGEPIEVVGAKLVHGSGIAVSVQNVFNSLSVDMKTDGGDSNRELRVNNWVVRNITPVFDPYIDIICTTNPNSWALVADYNTNRPVAEVAPLVGFADPVLFQKASNTMRVSGGLDQTVGDWHSMSQEYKGVIGYGGTTMEPKSLVASNGTG